MVNVLKFGAILCLAMFFFGRLSAAELIQPRGPALLPSSKQPILKINSQENKEKKSGAEIFKLQTGTANKIITVDLATQSLKYFEGTKLIGEFAISSGLPGTPTPTGQYSVIKKIPSAHYIGQNYDYPHTKWNLLFKPQAKGNLYIHGAYWHNNFGHPMSHGCINAAYDKIQPLYDWVDLGTKVVIQ